MAAQLNMTGMLLRRQAEFVNSTRVLVLEQSQSAWVKGGPPTDVKLLGLVRLDQLEEFLQSPAGSSRDSRLREELLIGVGGAAVVVLIGFCCGRRLKCPALSKPSQRSYARHIQVPLYTNESDVMSSSSEYSR